MPCVNPPEYYELMKLNKHHHFQYIKDHLKEGEVLSKEYVLEKSKDLEEGEEPVDDPDFIFDMALLQGRKQ